MDLPTLVEAVFGTNHGCGLGYRLVLTGMLDGDVYELTSRPGEVPQYTRNGVALDLNEFKGFFNCDVINDPYAFVFPKDDVETTSSLTITATETTISTQDLELAFHFGTEMCHIIRDGNRQPKDPSNLYVDVVFTRAKLLHKYHAKIEAAGLNIMQTRAWSLNTLRPLLY